MLRRQRESESATVGKASKHRCRLYRHNDEQSHRKILRWLKSIQVEICNCDWNCIFHFECIRRRSGRRRVYAAWQQIEVLTTKLASIPQLKPSLSRWFGVGWLTTHAFVSSGNQSGKPVLQLEKSQHYGRSRVNGRGRIQLQAIILFDLTRRKDFRSVEASFSSHGTLESKAKTIASQREVWWDKRVNYADAVDRTNLLGTNQRDGRSDPAQQFLRKRYAASEHGSQTHSDEAEKTTERY